MNGDFLIGSNISYIATFNECFHINFAIVVVNKVVVYFFFWYGGGQPMEKIRVELIVSCKISTLKVALQPKKHHPTTTAKSCHYLFLSIVLRR